MHPSDDHKNISLIPVTGILGRGIANSLSPMLHEFADQASGRMSDYHTFDIVSGGLDGFLSQVIEFGEIIGFNVTIPYKELVFNKLDAIHDSARDVGAVNTVLVRGEHLIGYNTDRGAFASSLKAAINEGDLPSDGWTVVLLGAGGAARAVLWALLDLKIASKIIISSRSEDRRFFLLLGVQEVCDQKNVKLLQYEWLDWDKIPIDSHAMLINATPLGNIDVFKGELSPSPIPPMDALRRFSLIIDLVYTPPITGLMKTARDEGIQAIGGGGMLIEQAVLSRAIWFGDGKEDEERAAMVACYSSWATKVHRELGKEV